MPAIYDLANRGLLPPGFSLIGFARRDWADQDFGKIVYDVGAGARPHAVPRGGLAHARRGHPLRSGHLRRRRRLRPARRRRSTSSTSSAAPAATTRSTCRSRPSSFATVCQQLERSGLSTRTTGPWRRVVIEKPFGHDLTVGPRAQRHRRGRLPRRTRCSASTTTWARRRCRTCWRCASPTSCSSRSGTPTTSTTCRSPWPRTSASAAGPATTTASAPPATSSRTTCCSCSRSPRWRSRSPSTPHGPARRRRRRCSRAVAAARDLGQRHRPRPVRRGLAGRRGGRRLPRGGRRRRRTRRTETYAAIRLDVDTRRWAGRAVLPAHRQAARPAGHRDRRGVQEGAAPAVRRTPRPRSSARTRSSSGCSPTRASPCGSARRCRARRWRSATSRWTSATATRSPSPRPEAYERLILDVLLGEPPLFPRHEEVELSWQILDPIEAFWAKQRPARAVPARAAGDPTSPTR